jgi:hypothetical protein
MACANGWGWKHVCVRKHKRGARARAPNGCTQRTEMENKLRFATMRGSAHERNQHISQSQTTGALVPLAGELAAAA